jgi:hypothetical protein
MNALELRKRFFDSAIADVLRAVDGRSLVGANTLSLCVIDYLSYLRPKNAKARVRANYRPIVDDYLTRSDARYDCAKIYALRCALVHTYAQAKEMKSANLTGYLFKHKDPSFHLSGSDTVLRLNTDTFVADVIWAAYLTFEENGADAAFQLRGDSLLVVGVPGQRIVSRKYEDFHPALREFDTQKPSLQRLRSAVTDLFK